MTIQLDTLENLTLDDAWRVGFAGSDITFSNRAMKRIRECREGFEHLLLSGKAGFVYGTTVAPGARAKTKLSQESQDVLAVSQNLWGWKQAGSRTCQAINSFRADCWLHRRPR